MINQLFIQFNYKKMKNKKNISFLLTGWFILSGMLSYSQIDIRGKIKQKVEERVEQKVDEKIDEGLDEIFNENEEIETEEEINNEGNESQSQKTNSTKPQEKPKLESYTKYDFIPGDKILFYEDFSQDAIGDFPALWTSNSGGEVKKVNIAEGKWFHLNGKDAVYCYSKTINFPDNFIIEFDIIPDAEYYHGITYTLYQEDLENPKEINDDLYPGLKGLHITLKQDGWTTKGYNNVTSADWLIGESSTNPVKLEEVNHVIIWIQKRRVRIYHNGGKALDVPTNIYSETQFNKMLFSGWDANSFPMVTNLKITTASPDMRSKLLTEGKIISYGIYFDSGKDIVKPESYGSLKEIAKILTENPEVKIKIIGHTDSDGNDALNLDLSKRRAQNVKNALIKDFSINSNRIQTDGKGEIEPLAPNTSFENKAKNRRVEFIKI